jgi:importin subunit beta-1
MVCQGTSARDERIRIASFTCLHEIAANYYSKLPPYMGEMFNISVKAINEDSEEVGLQAVEFWSTLCDIELDLADEDDPAEVRAGSSAERNWETLQQKLPFVHTQQGCCSGLRWHACWRR